MRLCVTYDHTFHCVHCLTKAVNVQTLQCTQLMGGHEVIGNFHYYLIIGYTSHISILYCIPLTDTTLTHSNLSTVLNHVVDVDQLRWCLNIPDSVWRNIKDHSEDEEQLRNELVYYWRNISPYFMNGWDFIGGRLHYFGEETALTAAKAYIQRAPGTCGCGMCMHWNVKDAYDHVYMTQQIHACSDVHCVCSSAFVDYTDAHTDHICAHVHLPTHPEPSLTLDNLTSVLDGVEDMDRVAACLHIPYFKIGELQQQYDSQQIKRAFSVYFMSHHPALSWLITANALWKAEEHGALEVVQKLYLKGEPCIDSCRSEARMSVSLS